MRASGQISLFLLFHLARAAASAASEVEKERLGVEDYLRLTPHRQNFQCQLIARVKNGTGNDHHWLGMAKEHLSRSFSVVGICERFEESLMLMAKTFGWEVPFCENQKVSKSRPMLEPKLVDLIREHNRLDDELYEFGKKLFEQNLWDTVKSGCQSSIRTGRFFLNKIVSAI